MTNAYKNTQRKLQASKDFPATYGERLIVRDGRGRPIEKLVCFNIEEGRNHKIAAYHVYPL